MTINCKFKLNIIPFTKKGGGESKARNEEIIAVSLLKYHSWTHTGLTQSILVPKMTNLNSTVLEHCSTWTRLLQSFLQDNFPIVFLQNNLSWFLSVGFLLMFWMISFLHFTWLCLLKVKIAFFSISYVEKYVFKNAYMAKRLSTFVACKEGSTHSVLISLKVKV